MPARPLYTGPKGRCGASDAVEGGDVGQVAVKPVVVEAVADNEHVGDRESHVIDEDIYLTPAALVEKHARPHASGPARLEHPLQRVERQTRVDDVVDDEDVTVGDVDREVDDEAHRARGGRGRAIAGGAHEVEGDIDREVTHEISDERDRTLENSDQDGCGPRVVAGDRGSELGHARGELAFRDEHSARPRKTHLTVR